MKPQGVTFRMGRVVQGCSREDAAWNLKSRDPRAQEGSGLETQGSVQAQVSVLKHADVGVPQVRS